MLSTHIHRAGLGELFRRGHHLLPLPGTSHPCHYSASVCPPCWPLLTHCLQHDGFKPSEKVSPVASHSQEVLLDLSPDGSAETSRVTRAGVGHPCSDHLNRALWVSSGQRLDVAVGEVVPVVIMGAICLEQKYLVSSLGDKTARCPEVGRRGFAVGLACCSRG